MMDQGSSYSEDEIRQQLHLLGYTDIPQSRLRQFKDDLDVLVQHERSKNSSSLESDTSQTDHGIGYSRLTQDISHQKKGSIYHVPHTDKENRYDRYEHEKFKSNTFPVNTGIRKVSGSRNTGYYLAGQNSVYKPKTGIAGNVPDDQSYDIGADLIKFRENFSDPLSAIDNPKRPKSSAEYSLLSEDTLDSRGHDADDDDSRVMYDRYEHDSRLLDETTDSARSPGRKLVKRKVLRRGSDGSKIVNESITESETDYSNDVVVLNERLGRLPLGEDTESESGAVFRCRRPLSTRDPPPYRLEDDFQGLKAVIRPQSSHPHTKNLKKSDPVQRYQEYSQAWTSQKAPGEKQHKGLRWSVREQMLYQDALPKKAHRVFVPNSYVVPTEKKRKALRWQVRNDIARGAMPPTNYDLYEY